jgi:DNA (cytosine-5)-methyltransferase 1
VKRPILIDLCCKAGGCSEGYRRAGWNVIGVDIELQPRYPFPFILADAIRAPIDWTKVDAIHASPPCQAFTAMRTMPSAKAHTDLLTPMREFLKATGKPFVIENVPGAPMRRDVVLCGTMFGLGVGDSDLRRQRWFEFGNGARLSELVPPCQHRQSYAIGVYGGRGQGGLSKARRRAMSVNVTGHAGGHSVRDGFVMHNTKERAEAMGIDWMKDWELTQAIPPAYTEFIGRQLLRSIGG